MGIPTCNVDKKISIHAPRTGSDTRFAGDGVWHINISIHAPRTGSDRNGKRTNVHTRKPFQSTLPARGATAEYLSAIAHRSISIHAPRTGSDQRLPCKTARFLCISIHAPRTGSDGKCAAALRCSCYFNPRSPHGERLSARAQRTPTGAISIHAPRTGSDHERFSRLRSIF